MNLLMDLRLLAVLAAILTAFLSVPLVFALGAGESLLPSLLAMALGIAMAAGGLRAGRRAPPTLRPRDGFLVASAGWAVAVLLGAVPYAVAGVASWPEALFESASGFTTTGASILPRPEDLPNHLLLWRSMTQWLGGMGMLLLAIAILPMLGVGGTQLMKAEVPGPNKERLTPRLVTTAQVLWGIYSGLTLLCILAYLSGGMSLFDAVNHAFTTLSTGGFSTRSSSLGGYSLVVQWWAILFMLLGGANFLLHYRLLVRRDLACLRDAELHLYLGIIATVGLILTAVRGWGDGLGVEAALREAFFQTLSIITTTGFANADWEQWAPAAQLLLVALMCVGGMSGSTSGGPKVVRIAVILQLLSTVTRRLLQPNRVVVLQLGGRSIHPEVVEGCVSLVAVFSLLVVASGLALNLLGMDMTSAMSAALTCTSNVGPGVGSVGAMDNFSGVPDLGKLLLVFDMVAGRLEIFTVVMLFAPGFWRR
ncbi:MAG: TrkH family potassium uptake protein [Magnetococcus sp. WYHC-3]